MLKRRLNFILISLYGVGNILGAGIYVLIGKIAGLAGIFVPVSFIIAFITASFMACTYSEISSRYPESSGEAVYVFRAFHKKNPAILIGLFIAFSGIVSAAVMFTGAVGYIHYFISVPDYIIIAGLILLFGFIANIGVAEAVGVASLFTLIEVAGLIIIILAGFDSLYTIPDRFFELVPGDFEMIPGILSGAFLAIYAFIGFEDMVNMADEIHEPEKNLPRAIIVSILITAVLYILVSLISILSMNPKILSASDAPLALVYEHYTAKKPVLISIISIFAILNGGLFQIIMASRILYGMSHRGWLPKWISYVHVPTGSPVASSGIVIALILLFALLFPVVSLARITSFFLLMVFSFVSLSLIRIKKHDQSSVDEKIMKFPVWVPWISFATSTGMIIVEFASLFR